MNDEEIITKLKITPGEKVLDIGGSLRQHESIEIDTLVDISRPEKTPYWQSPLKAKHFIPLDVTQQNLPFKDKEFDICLCTHVLEDLYNPFLVIDEMSRVAKRGYIATPSRGKDMEFSHFNLTDWRTGARRQPGLSHHHWFFENRAESLFIVPKIYPILYTPEFHIIAWSGDDECRYFWKNKIKYTVFPQIDTHAIIKEYRQFVTANSPKIKKGTPLIYIDNPFYVLKEFLKLLFHRGMGFKIR